MAKVDMMDLERAVDDLGTLRFFSVDSRAAVMDQLRRMMPSREALQWTIQNILLVTAEWPGLSEIRGVLCWKYDALDGIDGYSTLPRFNCIEGEARTLDAHKAVMEGSWPLEMFEGLQVKQLSGEVKAQHFVDPPARPQKRERNRVPTQAELDMLRAEAHSENPEIAKLANEMLRKYNAGAV